jgi:hypothetical protein
MRWMCPPLEKEVISTSAAVVFTVAAAILPDSGVPLMLIAKSVATNLAMIFLLRNCYL